MKALSVSLSLYSRVGEYSTLYTSVAHTCSYVCE